jgi:hypothetical protein
VPALAGSDSAVFLSDREPDQLGQTVHRLLDGVRVTDGVGDVVRPGSVESRVHFEDGLDPSMAGASHVVRPLEPAASTLESAVQEPCRAYPWAAGEAGAGTFGAAPLKPPRLAVDASVRVSRRPFSPWTKNASGYPAAKPIVLNKTHGHPRQGLLNNLFRHPSTKIEFINYVRMANVRLSC